MMTGKDNLILTFFLSNHCIFSHALKIWKQVTNTVGKPPGIKWPYFVAFCSHSVITSQTSLLIVVFQLIWLKIKNSKNRFL